MKNLIIAIVSLTLALPAFAADPKIQPLIKPGVTMSLAGSVTSNITVAGSAATLWQNPDGSVPSIALVASCVGTNANATNLVTFTLQTVPDGVTATTSANNSFAITLTANGTTAVVVSTNIPTAIIQGAKAIKLSSIVTGASSGGGGNLTVTNKIVGFAP